MLPIVDLDSNEADTVATDALNWKLAFGAVIASVCRK